MAHVPSPPWLDREAYPFRRRVVELSAGRMHFIDDGPEVSAGEAILFVHGTPTWSFEYRHLVRALAPEHRCIAPDHLGFGLSDRPTDGDYSPEWHARNLAEFVDRIDPGPLTLVVHDYRGPIALPLLFDRPGLVHRLIVLNSWMLPFDDRKMQKRAPIVSGRLGRFLYRRLNASLRLLTPSAYGDRKKLTRAIHRQYLAPFPGADSRERVLWALARAILASREHYASLWERRAYLASLPVLILWGLVDTAFPPHCLERWREAAPHARVVELPTAGHWPHEEAPDAVIEAIRWFVNGR
jgi:haloalkane dehalogenase